MRKSAPAAFMRLVGGRRGNEQLTAAAAILLVVLLAVEGATLLNLRSLLTVHAFVGMLLIPVVALKLGSVGWRMLRYYAGRAEYVEAGPPHIVLRTIVAPVIISSTVALFLTGVVLLVRHQTEGTLVGLHKASFVVWVGATTIHVLAHVLRVRRAIAQRLPGLALRAGLVATTVAAGTFLAVGTLPAADRLQDHVTRHFGVDER